MILDVTFLSFFSAYFTIHCLYCVIAIASFDVDFVSGFSHHYLLIEHVYINTNHLVTVAISGNHEFLRINVASMDICFVPFKVAFLRKSKIADMTMMRRHLASMLCFSVLHNIFFRCSK